MFNRYRGPRENVNLFCTSCRNIELIENFDDDILANYICSNCDAVRMARIQHPPKEKRVKSEIVLPTDLKLDNSETKVPICDSESVDEKTKVNLPSCSPVPLTTDDINPTLMANTMDASVGDTNVAPESADNLIVTLTPRGRPMEVIASDQDFFVTRRLSKTTKAPRKPCKERKRLKKPIDTLDGLIEPQPIGNAAEVQPIELSCKLNVDLFEQQPIGDQTSVGLIDPQPIENPFDNLNIDLFDLQSNYPVTDTIDAQPNQSKKKRSANRKKRDIPVKRYASFEEILDGLDFGVAVLSLLDGLKSDVTPDEVEIWCRGRAKTATYRNKGRGFGCDFDYWTMLDLLERSRMRCEYSGVPLQLKPHSEWLASIERIDPDEPYSQRNLMVILDVLNTSRGLRSRGGNLGNVGTNWNAEKVQAVPALRNQPIAYDWNSMLDNLTVDQPSSKLDHTCTWCGRQCDSSEVYPTPELGHCRKCRLAFLHSVVPENFTLDQVIQQIKVQGARCARSGVPLSFVFPSSWMCVVSVSKLDLEVISVFAGEFRNLRQHWTPQRINHVFGE